MAESDKVSAFGRLARRLADRALTAERDRLAARCEALASEVQRVEADRAGAWRAYEEAAAQRDAMTAARGELLGGEALTDRAQMLRAYWSSHPRFNFLKSLPPGALLLDVGAGAGGLAVWRDWGAPARPDIRLFGVDLPPERSAHAWTSDSRSEYERWQDADIEAEPLDFADGFFDAAVAAHVLEHLAAPWAALGVLFAKLKPEGRAYVELPAPVTKRLPPAAALVADGLPVQISNFHDDATHRDTWPLPVIAGAARRAGFVVEAGGFIRQPYLAEALLAQGRTHADPEAALYGHWVRHGWAQYIVLRKPAGPAAPDQDAWLAEA